jgi:hypothetical protein
MLARGYAAQAVPRRTVQSKKIARSMRSAFVSATLLLAGCDPVVAVAGAEFPDWLICVIIGSLITAGCQPVLRMSGLERYLRPLPLFYGGVVVMFSLVTWIILFSRV